MPSKNDPLQNMSCRGHYETAVFSSSNQPQGMVPTPTKQWHLQGGFQMST